MQVEGQTDQALEEFCKKNWRDAPDMCANFIPEGYYEEKATKQFTQEDQLKLEQIQKEAEQKANFGDLKCPKGTYYGRDNSGNPACRDIETNAIVDPTTGFRFPSDGIEGYVLPIGVGIIVIFIVISAIAIKTRPKRMVELEHLGRRNFSQDVEAQTLRNQNYKCKMCGKRIGVVNGRMVFYDFDHKDGDSSNNHPSNCQALCKNCHAYKTEKER